MDMGGQAEKVSPERLKLLGERDEMDGTDGGA